MHDFFGLLLIAAAACAFGGFIRYVWHHRADTYISRYCKVGAHGHCDGCDDECHRIFFDSLVDR